MPDLIRPATPAQPAHPFVIAEVGVNHDGDPGRAEALIHAAAHAGAYAVKLQLFHPDRLLSNQAELAGYQSGQAGSLRDLLARLALPAEAFAGLREVAHGVGLGFVVTPFSLGDVALLAEVGVDAVKVASPDAVNTPLLRAVCGLGVPVIVSTGACTLAELDAAVAVLRGQALEAVLLHCVSAYPTPLPAAALHGVAALAAHTGLPVGYSDHTQALHTGALAVAAGALVIEKHLTYDPNAAGPDHAASLGPEDFAQYVRFVREAAAMMGPAGKSPGVLEDDVKRVSRQSLCAARDLPAGHVLTATDLTIKRPGTGLPAAQFDAAIGRTLRVAVGRDDLLPTNALAPETDP